MTRLQKKCLLASVGMHLLLLVILLVGPAFLSSKNKSEDLPVIDFIPDQLIDAPFASKGAGKARSQTVTPPASQPPPPRVPPMQVAEKQREVDPPKTITRKATAEPDPVEPKHSLPQISTTLVSRKSKNSTKSTTTTADSKNNERQLAEQRRRLLREQFTKAANKIGDGASPTEIEYPQGAENNAGYANYAAWVKTVYENAWEAPEDAATSDAITKASVTIGSDGNVISSRISRASGDSPVDRSVQRALERVTFVAPFPEGAKERQRTFIINFNLKAKRGLA